MMTLETYSTKLINDLGKALTLRKVTEGTYDPTTGAISGQTTTDTSVKGMLLSYRNKDFEGTLIQRGDRKILIRASDSVVPEVQDIVLDSTIQYRLVDVRQIEEAGADVVYICQGRQ